jgi:nascent polypeptide-associated complex subunit alpha
MMRQMGMSQEEIEASRVIIETPNKKYIFENPSVQKIKMQGQTNFQVSGNFKEEEIKLEIQISPDDIDTVIEQAGVSKEEARKALEEAKGDIAQAIINLSS